MCQNVTQLEGPLNGTVGEATLFEPVNPPSAPPEHIVWIFNGQPEIVIINLRNDTVDTDPHYASRITLDNTTAALELRNLTLNDTGEYTVNFTSNGVQRLETFSLNVFGKDCTLALLKVMKHTWHEY